MWPSGSIGTPSAPGSAPADTAHAAGSKTVRGYNNSTTTTVSSGVTEMDVVLQGGDGGSGARRGDDPIPGGGGAAGASAALTTFAGLELTPVITAGTTSPGSVSVTWRDAPTLEIDTPNTQYYAGASATVTMDISFPAGCQGRYTLELEGHGRIELISALARTPWTFSNLQVGTWTVRARAVPFDPAMGAATAETRIVVVGGSTSSVTLSAPASQMAPGAFQDHTVSVLGRTAASRGFPLVDGSGATTTATVPSPTGAPVTFVTPTLPEGVASVEVTFIPTEPRTHRGAVGSTSIAVSRGQTTTTLTLPTAGKPGVVLDAVARVTVVDPDDARVPTGTVTFERPDGTPLGSAQSTPVRTGRGWAEYATDHVPASPGLARNRRARRALRRHGGLPRVAQRAGDVRPHGVDDLRDGLPREHRRRGRPPGRAAREPPRG